MTKLITNSIVTTIALSFILTASTVDAGSKSRRSGNRKSGISRNHSQQRNNRRTQRGTQQRRKTHHGQATKHNNRHQNNNRKKYDGKLNQFRHNHKKNDHRTDGKKFEKKHDGFKHAKHGLKHNLKGHVKHLLHGHKHRRCLPKVDWCHRRPKHCHWWYDYCTTIRYYQPQHCVTYSCNTVTSNLTLDSGVVIEDVRWKLGLTGILLPGKGFAIETVEANSPAAAVGLEPGMVIIEANGIAITEEADMPNAIAGSNGLLKVVVLAQLDGQPAEATIQMERVAAASF